MLDGKVYTALLSDNPDPDLIPRLSNPALLHAFEALADDLRAIIRQITLGEDADQLGDFYPP